jgi:hypothetical protein
MNVKIIAVLMMAVCVVPCFGMHKFSKNYLKTLKLLEASISKGDLINIEKALKIVDPLDKNSADKTFAAQAISTGNSLVRVMVLSKLPRKRTEAYIIKQVDQCIQANLSFDCESKLTLGAELEVLGKLTDSNPEDAQEVLKNLSTQISLKDINNKIPFEDRLLIVQAVGDFIVNLNVN